MPGRIKGKATQHLRRTIAQLVSDKPACRFGQRNGENQRNRVNGYGTNNVSHDRGGPHCNGTAFR